MIPVHPEIMPVIQKDLHFDAAIGSMKLKGFNFQLPLTSARVKPDGVA